MKTRNRFLKKMLRTVPFLGILCLALTVSPASAQVLYSNGPCNCDADAWTINYGFTVSDSFGVTAGATMHGFEFTAWEFPGDSVTSVDWSVTSMENGGTVYASGTAKAGASSVLNGKGGSLLDTFIAVNGWGYDIDNITVSGINQAGLTNMAGGNTNYWLNLQNAKVPNGDPVYWDENSGVGCSGIGCPSEASQSSTGTIPSEAFSITGTNHALGLSPDGTAPEPSSILLLGSGVLGLARVLRQRLNG